MKGPTSAPMMRTLDQLTGTFVAASRLFEEVLPAADRRALELLELEELRAENARLRAELEEARRWTR